MSTTLPHGIIQINEGNISWYGDITANWQLIDSKIGDYDAAIASIPAPANNGTLTINYAGTIIAMFGADDAGNVSANIPAPGDGTLTIQQNGTTVDTFTANSSSDKTVNVQCVDLTNNQTVGGNKEFTGTTTAHDLVPSATDTYNFGSPSYQWNNAYIKSLTINGVACGDILTHNASEFVSVSSNQTIGGVKTFSDGFSVNKPSPRLQMKSTTYSSETSSAMTIGDIALLGNNGGFSAWIVHQLRDDLTKRLCFRIYPHAGGTYRGFAFDDSCNLYPENSNSALGTSTNKWKSIYSNTYYLGDTAFGNIVTHNASEFALVSDLTSVLPIGSYIQFAGSQAPAGFIVCNGGEISRTTYSALFAVIGTTYGSGDGSTTFNLPNLTDRFLQGSTTSGTVKDAGLPNITGELSAAPRYVSSVRQDSVYARVGAFSYEGSEAWVSDLTTEDANQYSWHRIKLDASSSSSIYGNSSTVQPPALTCLICIKY